MKRGIGLLKDKGDRGLTEGEPAGEIVYVQWGHDSCPSTKARLVYSVRTAGSEHKHKGGGRSNSLWSPLDHQIST